MILVINIGNTNTSFYYFSYDVNFDSIKKFKVKTNSYSSMNDFFIILKRNIANLNCISKCIISSVVSNKTISVYDTIFNLLDIRPYVVTIDDDLCIDFSYYENRKLGIDRALSCYCALYKYSAPFIVFDLGTACTVNVVDDNLKFLGGAIFPSMHSMIFAISNDTDLNFDISIDENVKLLGTNTNDCILSGIFYSTYSTIKYYVDQITKRFNKPFNIILTGGNSKKIFDYCNNYILDENLVLEGLYFLSKKIF